MKKSRAFIVDLDGTICNIKHRLRHIKCAVPNWEKFNAACVNDEPIINTIDLVQWLSNKYRIILVTGRSETAMNDTYDWLCDNQVPGHILFMRKEGDYRPDHEIKGEIYDTKIEPIYDVVGVIEDRDQAVKMWRDKGLICYQCADGSY